MANGLCTSCQGLQRVIDQWEKRDELDRYRADAAEAEVDRLRAANEHLADALADIADGECSRMDHRRCHNVYPAEPYEWCPTCVAVVGWSAWRMGVIR